MKGQNFPPFTNINIIESTNPIKITKVPLN
jgi:hypothetical protein